MAAAKPKWPREATDAYEPIRPLGQGAFGLVWLARHKTTTPRNDVDESPSPGVGDDEAALAEDDQQHAYAAMKRIRTSTESDRAYAEREIAITSELRHPNVVRLYRAFRYDGGGGNNKKFLLAMELANGPDVGKLIEIGGALNVKLCRLVARHLIAAVSYLHGRGVVHRDLKPDNCILVRRGASPSSAGQGTLEEGATRQDDDLTDNDSVWDDDAKEGAFAGADEEIDRNWKVMLVDFGFARALGPSDIGARAKDGSTRSRILNEGSSRAALAGLDAIKEEAGENNMNGKDGDDAPPTRSMSTSKQRMSTRRNIVMRRNMRESVARRPVKALSALGTRGFAAPEVQQKARDKTDSDRNNAAVGMTECIADYGMIADAYSVGCTLKVALTGVPADVGDVAGYIASQSSPLESLLSMLFAPCRKQQQSDRRQKKFRYVSDVPKNASALVRDMTKARAEERLTVREAQAYPWICGGGDEKDYGLPQGDVPSRHGDPIVYLKCATDG